MVVFPYCVFQFCKVVFVGADARSINAVGLPYDNACRRDIVPAADLREFAGHKHCVT